MARYPSRHDEISEQDVDPQPTADNDLAVPSHPKGCPHRVVWINPDNTCEDKGRSEYARVECSSFSASIRGLPPSMRGAGKTTTFACWRQGGRTREQGGRSDANVRGLASWKPSRCCHSRMICVKCLVGSL